MKAHRWAAANGRIVGIGSRKRENHEVNEHLWKEVPWQR